MTAPAVPRSLATRIIRRRDTLLRTARHERGFLVLLGLSFFAAGALYPYPSAAMWLGFALAGYSTIANDSIQTVGTFLSSNRERPWWLLWFFIGGVFLLTVGYSWVVYDGDVSYGRLAAKGFTEAPTRFSFLQVAAPAFLLILTRLRMPVSTTFLILSCFATDPEGILAVLEKSLWGYGVAFVVAIAVWFAVTRAVPSGFGGSPSRWWNPAQWASTAFLWATWIMQDAANVAVYLPRQLSLVQFAVFSGGIVAGLGILFYLRGDRIQRVVSEKTDTVDVRSATLIDFVYGLILYGFKEISSVPMSTTWVFIGLLAGREVAFHLGRRTAEGQRPIGESLRLIRRDLVYAGIGLAVSIALALASNPALR